MQEGRLFPYSNNLLLELPMYTTNKLNIVFNSSCIVVLILETIVLTFVLSESYNIGWEWNPPLNPGFGVT